MSNTVTEFCSTADLEAIIAEQSRIAMASGVYDCYDAEQRAGAQYQQRLGNVALAESISLTIGSEYPLVPVFCANDDVGCVSYNLVRLNTDHQRVLEGSGIPVGWEVARELRVNPDRFSLPQAELVREHALELKRAGYRLTCNDACFRPVMRLLSAV